MDTRRLLQSTQGSASILTIPRLAPLALLPLNHSISFLKCTETLSLEQSFLTPTTLRSCCCVQAAGVFMSS